MDLIIQKYFILMKNRLPKKSKLCCEGVNGKTLEILLLLGRPSILRREGSSFLSLKLGDPAVIASD